MGWKKILGIEQGGMMENNDIMIDIRVQLKPYGVVTSSGSNTELLESLGLEELEDLRASLLETVKELFDGLDVERGV